MQLRKEIWAKLQVQMLSYKLRPFNYAWYTYSLRSARLNQQLRFINKTLKGYKFICSVLGINLPPQLCYVDKIQTIQLQVKFGLHLMSLCDHNENKISEVTIIKEAL